ncbi:hypothetical protein JCM3770_004443 [Rhodotorula araucariae]
MLDAEATVTGAARPCLAPGDRRSSDLLSLLHGGQRSQPAQQPSPAPQQDKDGRVVSPTSPPGGNARQLLGLLMAGAPQPQPRHSQPQVSQAAPDFSLVSPFSRIAKTPVPDEMGAISPGTSAPPQLPLSSVPVHVRVPSGSDSSEATSAPQPLALAGAPGATGQITQAYLAAQYLAAGGSSASSLPDAAPAGLRLPRSAYPPHETQHLTITLAEAHAESLAPSIPPTTPITLLPLPAAFPAARRSAGIWPRGIAYATAGGKGRVRIIDRETGARVLLKGAKSGDIRELRVSPYIVGGRRTIATVTEDGALAVWTVADAFENEEQAECVVSRGCPPGYATDGMIHTRSPHRLRDLVLPQKAVSLVRFSPDAAAQTVAVVCSDSTIQFVRFDRKNEPRQLAVPGSIADAAYSADGSTFAILAQDGQYTLYSTERLDVVHAGSVAIPDEGKADQLALLASAESADGLPAALAISSQRGTHISLVTLADPVEPAVIKFTAPPGMEHLWGQMAYHTPAQSLLVAHSLRGSLYAFRLAFSETGGVRIEHVLEHPTPEPLISFVIDTLPSVDPHAQSSEDSADLPPGVRAAPAAKVAFGALLLHPRGVSHLGLSAWRPRPAATALATASAAASDGGSEPDLAALAGRRMSLEGSIYVSSEVSVQVDDPETDELSLKVAVPPSPSPSLSPVLALSLIDEPVGGDLGGGLTGARTPVAGSAGGGGDIDSIRLAGPVVNAAIRNMKARQAASASPSPPESSAPLAAAATDKDRDGETVLRELRRIEAVLPGKIGNAVSRELEKHVSHLEDHAASSAPATSARDEALVALVQQTVTRDVARVVESAVASQVAGAVRAQMGRGVEEALARALPVELEKQLNRPGLSLALASSIASSIARPLERHLTGTLVKVVVPALEQKLAAAVDGVMGSIRMEMVDVRKEVVQEQSGAVSILEDEVASLRGEVSALKAMVEQMHALAVGQNQQARAPRLPAVAAVVSPRVVPPPVLASASGKAQAPPPRHVSPPFASIPPTVPAGTGNGTLEYALPPIPRAPTPPERYEELFTEAMQPQHAPGFTALTHLIASAPLSRLDAVFPGAPSAAVPKISMAVVLSLAYRLAQLVADKEGPLDVEGRKQLLWLRKAIAACDGKQPPELVALIPRILTTVTDHLAARLGALIVAGDTAGANEVRLVQQYAHARLSLFEQAGARGGIEPFRR